MNRREIMKILNQFKKLIGLSDYTIIIEKGFLNLGDGTIAEAEPDMYEKEIKIKLSKEFKKLPDIKKRNTLIHELIHSRFDIHKKTIETIMDEHEEMFINDLTRAIEKIK